MPTGLIVPAQFEGGRNPEPAINPSPNATSQQLANDTASSGTLAAVNQQAMVVASATPSGNYQAVMTDPEVSISLPASNATNLVGEVEVGDIKSTGCDQGNNENCSKK